MTYQELQKWSREAGRALPHQKSKNRWGLSGSTKLDRPTFTESYDALRDMFPDSNYPQLNQ